MMAPKANTGGKKIVLACIILFLANILSTGFLAVSHSKALDDGLQYFMIAKNLAEGKGFSSDAKTDVRSPVTRAPYPQEGRLGYPFILSLFFRIFSPSIELANFISASFKSLTVIVIFLLGVKLFDFRVGFLAGVLYSLNPFFMYVGILNLADTTFNFFYYAGLFFGLTYLMNEKRLHIFISGVFSAISVVIRADALVLVGFIAFVLLVKTIRQKKNKEDLIMFISPFIIVFGLKSIYNLTTFGSMFYSSRVDMFIPEGKYIHSLKKFSPEEYWEAIGGLGGWISIRWYNLKGFYLNSVANGILWPETTYAFVPVLMVIPLTVGIIYLILKGGGIKNCRPKYILYVTLLLTLQITALLFYEGSPLLSGGFAPRDGQITFPFLMLLMSLGLIKMWDIQQDNMSKSNVGRLNKNILWAALKVFAVFLTINYLVYAYNGNNEIINQLIRAPPYSGPTIRGALWVKENLPRNVVLMSMEAPKASYFSGKSAVMMPYEDFEVIMDYAKEHHVTHIIMTHNEATNRQDLADSIVEHSQGFSKIYRGKDFEIIEIRRYDI